MAVTTLQSNPGQRNQKSLRILLECMPDTCSEVGAVPWQSLSGVGARAVAMAHRGEAGSVEWKARQDPLAGRGHTPYLGKEGGIESWGTPWELQYASSFIVTQAQWAQAAGWCWFRSAVGPGQVGQAWCGHGVKGSAELTLVFCSSAMGRPSPLGAPSLRTTTPAAARCSPWLGSGPCSWTSLPLRHPGTKLHLLQSARVSVWADELRKTGRRMPASSTRPAEPCELYPAHSAQPHRRSPCVV